MLLFTIIRFVIIFLLWIVNQVSMDNAFEIDPGMLPVENKDISSTVEEISKATLSFFTDPTQTPPPTTFHDWVDVNHDEERIKGEIKTLRDRRLAASMGNVTKILLCTALVGVVILGVTPGGFLNLDPDSLDLFTCATLLGGSLAMLNYVGEDCTPDSPTPTPQDMAEEEKRWEDIRQKDINKGK